ncbi:hypothetical protein [Pedobacter sp.]|uniref:hypothetical protein n=1 Tax=Pedobacter sp. TaxID=1411316 RepID=UPI003BAC7C10
MRKEAYQSQGLAIPNSTSTPNTSNYDLTVWDQNRYTDWQEELIGGKARYTDAQLTMSGGSANTQVVLGANYHKETTVMPGDPSDVKGSVHVNLSHSSVDQRFRFSFNGSYMGDKNILPGIDLTASEFLHCEICAREKDTSKVAKQESK